MNNNINSGAGSPMAPCPSDDESRAGHALSDFLLQLEDYSPTVPDSVVSHYLNMSGFEAQDPRLVTIFIKEVYSAVFFGI